MKNTPSLSPTSLLSFVTVASLAFSASLMVAGHDEDDTVKQIDRYQIRVVSQSQGATAVVMVDSATGQAWAQRLVAEREPAPWFALGRPK
ncbi:MAG: hypothetical protein AAF726_13430 [Planctomycetota bacterium]